MMTVAELRELIAKAEWRPRETTADYIARVVADSQLSRWRDWLPALLADDACRNFNHAAFFDAIATLDPEGRGIVVKVHPNGDWSVIPSPPSIGMHSLSLMIQAEAEARGHA